MGIPPEELYRMDLETFGAAAKAWNDREESFYRTSWEQTRFLAQCLLTPYSKRKIRAEDILKFPWEDKRKAERPKPHRLTAEELERIGKRFGEG